MAVQQVEPRLLGRRIECDTLDRLLASARAGHGQALVVRGEAGVGKSALLDYLGTQASGCRIARAFGIESEMELAFAGVHQLCSPMLGRLTRLPEPQREALRTALGLSAAGAPDLFLVGLAVLGLLSESAGDRPLLCLIDDAQWLDRASARVLGFVARRLLADPVALVFVVREPAEEPELRGLPDLTIGGLGDDDARALLESAVPGRLDEQVRDRIVAESRGNPLALLELPRGLTAAEMAGGFALPVTGEVTNRIEQSFVRRVRSLPADTQRLLLVAAAEPVGDVTLLARATARLGISSEAAAPAVASGLIELGARVRFRHPLVRSAVYRSAALTECRDVHRALADVIDPASDPDRRAWHRAQAAVAPDEAVAEELERAADRAQGRGGAAATAAFLERATALTPDPERRGARALEAAQAKFEAAAPHAANELLAIAELCPLSDLQRARLARLHARIVFAERRGSDAPPLLVEAARQFAALDAGSARETLVEALEAAIIAGRLSGPVGMREVAEAARATPSGPRPRPVDLLLDGVVEPLIAGYATGLPKLRLALKSFRRQVPRSRDEIMRWLWLAPIAQEASVHQLWDYEAWDELATRSVRLAREAGALGALPVALVYLAGVRLHAGNLAGASTLIEEADAITAATRYAPVSYAALVLVAWRGDEPQALDLMAADVQDAKARGEGIVLALAGYATALLYNGLSRYEAALAGARRGCDDEGFGFFGWTLVELIEAATRTGSRDVADAALRHLIERTTAADTDWSLGLLARSRALLSEGQAADLLYREAIERLEHSGLAGHLARARLTYGEWLRREDRRVDAREQLRLAHDMLSGFGAEGFAERARRELVATGETVQKRTTSTRDVLTAQEAQVARLAAEGNTNAEIGSQLFISPRTAEYHLHKVYTKLGIRSRRKLRTALRDPAHAVLE